MTGKGRVAVSLEAARLAIGDGAFQAAIDDLATTAEHRTVTINDVVEALEARGGRRLTGLRQGLGLVAQADDDGGDDQPEKR